MLAFDWNGNYLGGVKMDILAQDYTYDSKNKILYGYRIFDEKIIAYDLSEFVNSFAKWEKYLLSLFLWQHYYYHLVIISYHTNKPLKEVMDRK